jgi:2-iminobutanoate/2-iminopropanoate deaminase
MPKLIHDVNAAPRPVGPYSIATEANGFVFISGQVGVDPATSSVVEGGVEAEARQIVTNLTAILDELGLTPQDVVKTTVFITDMSNFGVVNAIYATLFDGADPARSTVEVAGLPLGVTVEIEVIAAR